MHNFFITGLPRTRTSWFANLFTYGNSFCFHELGAKHKDSYGIREELVNMPQEYKGIADCGLPYYYENLADTLQSQRLVIIDRDKADVMDSLYAYMGKDVFDGHKILEVLTDVEERIKYIRGRYEHRSYDFADLNNQNVIQEIWDYCVPGLPLNIERWEMLDKLNISPNKKKWVDSINMENLNSLVGI